MSEVKVSKKFDKLFEDINETYTDRAIEEIKKNDVKVPAKKENKEDDGRAQ